MEISQHIPEPDTPHTSRKWSRLGQLAKGAAIAQCNRERARRVSSRGCWSDVEKQIVIDTYPNYKLMQKRLPHRNLGQLKGIAAALGIRKKRHLWTTKEIAVLRQAHREGWTKERLYGAFPNLTRSQVHSQWIEYGFGRRLQPKELGVPVLDEIRAHAYRMNLSIADLDEICGGGVYWKNCLRKPNWKRVAKVVEFMGGRLRVEFDDLDA